MATKKAAKKAAKKASSKKSAKEITITLIEGYTLEDLQAEIGKTFKRLKNAHKHNEPTRILFNVIPCKTENC